MNNFKRFLAVLIILLCIITILVSTAQIVSVWALNTRIKESSGKILQGTYNGLEVAVKSLNRVDVIIGAARSGVQTVEQSAANLEGVIQESNPIIDVISLIIGQDITPKIERALELVTTVSESVNSLNDILQGLNGIPFVNIETISEPVLQLTDQLNELTDQLLALDRLLEDAKNQTAEVLPAEIANEAQRMDAEIAAFQDDLSEFRQQLEAAMRGINWLQTGFPAAFNTFAIILTIYMFWAVASQVLIVYLGWNYLKTGLLPWQTNTLQTV